MTANGVGPVVIPEVRPFRERELWLGLPHPFFCAVLFVTLQLALYLNLWLAAGAFFLVCWALGRAGTKYDPCWFEILLMRLPFLPKVIAP